jgi:hypothetical protein
MKTVQELIQEISRGDLQLPEFQRGYVWNSDKVRALIESLYRKRPTGHFLIWHAYKPIPARGSTQPSQTKQVLLLDGQQRLTSLYVLFKGTAPPFYEGEALSFNLFFNVQTQEFRFYQRSLMANNAAWRDVSKLFVNGGIYRVHEDLHKLPPEERSILEPHLSRLAQLDDIRNHRYQVDELTDEELSVNDVVEIFNRVNSAGTPLSRADLAMAHVCVKWPEARSELRTFSEAMRREGFGLEPELLIRAIAGAAGETVIFTSAFNKISADKLKDTWPRVRSSFEYLVNILREHAWVASLDDLPSPLVMVPLIVHLARNGSQFHSAKERDRFVRWMFLANIWGRYAGQTDTRLQRDINRLAGDDPTSGLIAEILADRGRINIEARDLDGKGSQTALFKFAYIVTRSREAQDWFNGSPLYVKAVGRSNALESHHIFPRDVLKKAGFGVDRSAVNEVANRAFLTKKTNLTISNKYPAKYLPQVEKRYPGSLNAQCVPMDPDLWKVDAYEHFLHERRKLFAKVMNKFLDRLGHNADQLLGTSANIEALLEREEGEELEFKSSLRWDHDNSVINRELEKAIVKTVAGFLNARRGGILLIGVRNDRSIAGLAGDYEALRKPDRDDRDSFVQHLNHLLVNGVGEASASFVTATPTHVKGGDVCQVVVSPSNQPVWVTEGASSTFYLRINNQTQPVPIREVARYIESRWGDGPPGYVPAISHLSDTPADQESMVGSDNWVDGPGAFQQALELANFGKQADMERLLNWAVDLDQDGLLEALWSRGGASPRLALIPKGDSHPMAHAGADGTIRIYRSVVERCAPKSLAVLEELTKPIPLGKGRIVDRPSDALLAALAEAYREAASVAKLVGWILTPKT